MNRLVNALKKHKGAYYMSDTLSIVIPAMNEAQNLARLIPQAWHVIERLDCKAEIIVVVGPSTDDTALVARERGAHVIEQTTKGYGGALAEGFAAARGEWILTMDADLSHPPVVIGTIWAARETADMLIASRYVRSGSAAMPLSRMILSRILNLSFPFLLSLPIKDMSSGFRLYRREVVRDVTIKGTNFDALQELLMGAYAAGWRVREVPFAYQPRGTGQSKASLVRFAKSYLKTLRAMWNARNNLECADYDERAYTSRNPVQRAWQHWRHAIILSMARNFVGTGILHVGCGSSRILQDLPGAVGVDANERKVRYMQRYRANTVVTGSVTKLPFDDAQFDCVICTGVLEHTSDTPSPLDELLRVLDPQGTLIVSTPDWDTRAWQIISPLAHLLSARGASSVTTRYTRTRLEGALSDRGWVATDVRYVFGAELITAFQRETIEASGRPTMVLLPQESGLRPVSPVVEPKQLVVR